MRLLVLRRESDPYKHRIEFSVFEKVPDKVGAMMLAAKNTRAAYLIYFKWLRYTGTGAQQIKRLEGYLFKHFPAHKFKVCVRVIQRSK